MACASTVDERITTDTVEAKARATVSTSLPPPLTHAALNEAYTQLTPGASESIKSMMKWWRANKLSTDDVLVTVKSFHGSSAALRKIFPRHAIEGEVAPEGEVASEEEMIELSRLLCKWSML